MTVSALNLNRQPVIHLYAYIINSFLIYKQTNSVALSPRANYTD
jgi:hypothetical protein